MDYTTEIKGHYTNITGKASFCADLALYLKEQGFKKINGFSIYRNWFSRGDFPKEEIKLKFIYEYIKQYQSKISGKAETQTEPSSLDATS